MSKERLEEIEKFKSFIDSLDDSADADDFHKFIDTCQINYEEGTFNEILRFMKSQAGRVQELEDTLEQDARQGVLEGLYEENKRYRGKIMTSIEELELVLYSGKSDDVKELYLKNAVRFLNEALEGDPHESS